MTISISRKRYFRRALLRWYRENGRTYPWRSHEEPYPVLLAEVLLQRTQAAQVARHYDTILTRFPTPSDLGSTPYQTLADALKPLGLTKRAATLKRMGNELARRFGQDIPSDIRDLRSLPGVGRYIGAATSCFAFGEPAAIVDTNVVRLYSRFFGLTSVRARPRDDSGIWSFAQTMVPRKASKEYNRALIDFAGAVCQPRAPRCNSCPVRRRCCLVTGDD